MPAFRRTLLHLAAKIKWRMTSTRAALRDVQPAVGRDDLGDARAATRPSRLAGLTTDEVPAVMILAPWLVCALIAWFMWWYWQRQKRK